MKEFHKQLECQLGRLDSIRQSRWNRKTGEEQVPKRQEKEISF